MTVLSQLKEGKVHYRHSGVKGLGKYDIGSAIDPSPLPLTEQIQLFFELFKENRI